MKVIELKTMMYAIMIYSLEIVIQWKWMKQLTGALASKKVFSKQSYLNICM
jgi:hypothetical protein